MFFFFKQKTAYEMRISDWSSDVCSSDLLGEQPKKAKLAVQPVAGRFARRRRARLVIDDGECAVGRLIDAVRGPVQPAAVDDQFADHLTRARPAFVARRPRQRARPRTREPDPPTPRGTNGQKPGEG